MADAKRQDALVAGSGSARETPGEPPRHSSGAPHAGPHATPGTGDALYNLHLLGTIAHWCQATLGDEALRQLCEAGGVQAEWFEERHHWVSWQQFEAVLAAARALVASDEEFSAITVYQLQQKFRHLRLMFWAATPSLVYRAAERLGGFFSTVGRFKVDRITQHSARLRWVSACPESRLVCLARREASRLAPTWWGMPPAHVREYKCIAWGDDCCDYEFYFLSRRRPLPALLGGALGVCAVAAIASVYPLAGPIQGFVPILGALAGYLYERRRVERANSATESDVADSFRDVMADAADAHHKATALAERLRSVERATGPADSGAEHPPIGGAIFRREGDYWSITWEGTVCRLRNAKGLHYIAQLLRHPGQEFHARELLAVVAENPDALPTAGRGLRVRGGGDAGAVFDAQAKADYQQRLRDLRAELEEAERFNDPGRVSRVRDEIELITDQLAAATGLGGRDRVAGSEAERARLAVTKRIKAALVKIRQTNPSLARHLTAAITTGYFCCYAPTVDALTSWIVG